ncbi:hypothetical protein PS15p_202999 [Mucor circinelloides]
MILNCIGENENAWIRSWNYYPTNPQVLDCLAISVGFSGLGGGIDLEFTQTLVPQFGGVYNIPYTIPAGNNEATTYYGSASDIEIEKLPLWYRESLLSIQSRQRSAPSTTLVSNEQPTKSVYTFNEILPVESVVGESSSNMPATHSLL